MSPPLTGEQPKSHFLSGPPCLASAGAAGGGYRGGDKLRAGAVFHMKECQACVERTLHCAHCGLCLDCGDEGPTEHADRCEGTLLEEMEEAEFEEEDWD